MCTQKHCSKSDYFTHSQHVVSSTFTSVFLCCLLLPCCMTNASAANSPPIQSINSDIFSQVVATYWRLGGGPTWWPSVFIVNNKRKHLCMVMITHDTRLNECVSGKIREAPLWPAYPRYRVTQWPCFIKFRHPISSPSPALRRERARELLCDHYLSFSHSSPRDEM